MSSTVFSKKLPISLWLSVRPGGLPLKATPAKIGSELVAVLYCFADEIKLPVMVIGCSAGKGASPGAAA